MLGPINTDTSNCVIGFDVWGTLFKLEEIFELLAIEASRLVGGDLRVYRARILEAYEEARKLRRLNPDIKPFELLEQSRTIMASKLGVSRDRVDEIIDLAFRKARSDILFEDVIPTLQQLREKDVSMGIIGNVLFWPSKYTRLLLETVGIARYFHELVFSDEVGSTKPDRRIFLYFAERMNLHPSRVIYVGDNVVEDVGGALSAGCIGVLVDRKRVKNTIVVPELRAAVIPDLRSIVNIYSILCTQ